MSFTKLSEQDQITCIQIARASILYGLKTGNPHIMKTEEYSADLQQHCASFVTLNTNFKLRGCIGSLDADQPLINDIAENAYAAAFKDPRFPPLTEDEFSQLGMEISILTEPETMTFDSEQELLQQIEPGVDGLILQYDFNRGTFLPAVWHQLPDKKEFLDQLKIKAGLDSHWWNSDVSVRRFHTYSFSSYQKDTAEQTADQQ
ncbi:MAG: AmmeMemoRadiSam system protein A [Gammaproteobacteria bacterium]|nr:AmmeMemoRadiSam system protein A [Gammaproteobacteria bacterium]